MDSTEPIKEEKKEEAKPGSQANTDYVFKQQAPLVIGDEYNMGINDIEESNILPYSNLRPQSKP